MTPDVTSPPAEADPVRAALENPAVWRRMCAAARAFVGRPPPVGSPIARARDAEEVASEAKLRAWQRRADFDPARDVVRWLVGFVSVVARERAKWHPGGPPADGPGLDDLAADLGRPVADAVADADHAAALLAHLPPADADLVRMHHFDHLTHAEVAARIGSNENAVRVRYHRLMGRLREIGRAAGEVRP